MAQETAAASSGANEVINLLALDGGGIRGISELLILNELMRRIQYDQQLAELPRPCDYFDLIGGTSTGGLIALMLGRLRMRTDEAIETYNTLARAIFSKGNKKWKGQDGLLKASTLEDKVKKLVSSKEQGERMLDPSTYTTKGKAFVCAMPARNMEYPRRFRTYPVRALASANCEIWEAARATSAAPTFFKRIAISDGSGGTDEFVDGGLRCNNPAKQVLEEAKAIFGNNQAVGCLVSIGTGYPGTIGLVRPDSFQKFLPTKMVDVLQRIATDCETTANELSARFQEHEKFFYRFNVEHGAEGISLKEWKKMDQMRQHTTAYMTKVAVSKAIDEVVGMLCQPKSMGRTLGSLDGISSLFSFSVSFSLSEVSEISYFTARENELADIHSTLNKEDGRNIVILHGMGGIGKTQVTIAYAKRHKSYYSAIFWLNCKDEDSLKQSFLRAAQRILREYPLAIGLAAVKEGKSLDEVVDVVKLWFDQRGNTRWLLIYDNYDNPKMPRFENPNAVDLKRHFPDADHGSIIVTTRLSQVGLGHRIEMKKLDDIQDSLRILARTSDQSIAMKDSDARKIAERLDGLPLALATAGAYLRQVETSFARYLELYEASWLKLQQRTPSLDSYDRALYSTWQLSYTHIEQQNPLSAKLLQLLAYFDNKDVWFELLHKGHNHGHNKGLSWFSELVEDELSFTAAARVICNHGLIEVDTSLEEGATESKGYSMHSCVHTWTIHVLNQEWDAELARLALVAVAAHVPDGGTQESWITQRRLMRHAARCWSFVANSHVSYEGLAWALHNFGDLYKDQDKLDKAEEVYTSALAGNEQALGPSHTSTLGTVNNLGNLYRDQGKLEKAEEMYVRALARKEQALGPNDASTLDAVNNLGNLYHDQGKLDKAEEMYVRALAGEEQELGLNHTSTLNTINNLGNLYRDQGKLDEAQEMYVRALGGREQALGPNHTLTLGTVNNLAVLSREQGKLKEAEEMSLRAFAGLEQTLGPTHTMTLVTVNNIATLYSDQGKLDEAEEMYLRALTGREQALGPNHTSTLETANNLGNLYRDQGMLDQAEEMYLRALTGLERALGSTHTSTLATVNNLGNLYREQEKLDKAEEMLVQALSGREQALGANHASTLETANNLGNLYRAQGKLDQAEEMYLRALTGLERALGSTHTSTLATVNNLGNLYREQEKLDKAEEMLVQALSGREQALGANHISTLQTVNGLGNLYISQGKLDEAAVMYMRALTGLEQALGSSHILTLQVVNNLGVLYRAQGKLDKAEEMYVRALAGLERALGSSHTLTLQGVNNLGILYRAQGKLVEAEAMELRNKR